MDNAFVTDADPSKLDQFSTSGPRRAVLERDAGVGGFTVLQIVRVHDPDTFQHQILEQRFLDLLRTKIRPVVNGDLFPTSAKPQITIRVGLLRSNSLA